MKIGILKSIGHNIADSVASGIGLMIGVYSMDIFDEASKSKDGHIVVDFLTGSVIAGYASESLQRAMKLYSDVLPELCAKHGASVSDFKSLTVQFGVTASRRRRFIVSFEDSTGKKSVESYFGSPGQKARRR